MSDKVDAEVSVSPIQCPKSSTEMNMASTSCPPSSDTYTSLLEEIKDLRHEQARTQVNAMKLVADIRAMWKCLDESEQHTEKLSQIVDATADAADSLCAEVIADIR
ncbi:hypothetical protein SCP_0312900 [Sparassis crispa]|uniref:Uncharacterized protein n=1 Tax=Sparassis crispa TaxID=139825 RepID=A0A401GHG6_9APHY|nr:hypothetical protein SCP_0312900 [Sparassis crispa]GBE81561.1 hypothetical protein SCP_0312900 [Sparassis crispa]